MGRKSKEEEVLELFFIEPTKHWHFKEIKLLINIADNKISRWLKEFIRMKLITRIKEEGSMPYYISNYQNPEYQNRKKLFSIKKLYESGFLNHLMSLNAKTIILFGSFSRWDWHKNSDIDLFIYGDDEDLEQAKYEKILNHKIQLFSFKNKSSLKKIPKELLQNIVKGNIISGDLNFLEVKISKIQEFNK